MVKRVIYGTTIFGLAIYFYITNPMILKIGVVFTAFGCLFETLFTGITGAFAYRESKQEMHSPSNVFGYWSLHYIPLYGMFLPWGWINIAQPIFLGFSNNVFSIIFAYVIVAVLLQIGEFLTMALLHFVYGEAPCEKAYKPYKDSVFNFTRLSYYPVFFYRGLVVPDSLSQTQNIDVWPMLKRIENSWVHNWAHSLSHRCKPLIREYDYNQTIKSFDLLATILHISVVIEIREMGFWYREMGFWYRR